MPSRLGTKIMAKRQLGHLMGVVHCAAWQINCGKAE
jgi:hypothetical protein